MAREVQYFHANDPQHANIIWAERDGGSSYYRTSRYACRNGKFPPDHPTSPDSNVFGKNQQGGDSPSMDSFRAKGYWASCFPEGDGITMTVPVGVTREQVVNDIQECFGFAVKGEEAQ